MTAPRAKGPPGAGRGQDAAPRRPPRVRIVAAAIALIFALVATATTVVSVGRYCITSDGGNTAALPAPRR